MSESITFKERFSDLTLRGDLLGGLTTAIISLPLALAFGVASGAGPQAGLYGAVIVGLFAALFGGSRTLISEPTGPMTVIMTAIITTMIAEDPENGLAGAFVVVLIAGLTQILFGVFKLGRYLTLMPYSVISGFMSGIGVLLIIMQMPALLGQPTPGGGALNVLIQIPQLLSQAAWQEILLGAIGMVCLFAIPKKMKRVVPPHLIALLLGTSVALIFFADVDIRRIGEIPMGLPDFRPPHLNLEKMPELVVDGIILGMLGCIDTLLTAMIADSLTRKQHDSNRELVGQGIANFISGLFGGLPGAGATMGTVVGIQVGARSPLAAILRALFLLIVILATAPMLSGIPLALLAAIAVKVGIDILDWSFLKRAHQVSRTATVIMYGVMGITVFFDLLVAVGIGVFIANVLTIEKLSRLQSSGIRAIDDTDGELPLSDEERAIFRQGQGRLLLLHLNGPMIFGVAKAISREQAAVERANVLVLDLLDVPLLSTTVLLALENVIKDAQALDLPIFICTPDGEAHERLKKLQVTQNPSVIFCTSRLDALQRAVAAQPN